MTTLQDAERTALDEITAHLKRKSPRAPDHLHSQAAHSILQSCLGAIRSVQESAESPLPQSPPRQFDCSGLTSSQLARLKENADSRSATFNRTMAKVRMRSKEINRHNLTSLLASNGVSKETTEQLLGSL